MRNGKWLILVAAGLLAAFSASGAFAAPKNAGFAKDYSDMRGFNYQPASTRGYTEEWAKYPHAEIDRDMGYAQKRNMNLARVFMSYTAWSQDKAGYRVGRSGSLQDLLRALADPAETRSPKGGETHPQSYRTMTRDGSGPTKAREACQRWARRGRCRTMLGEAVGA